MQQWEYLAVAVHMDHNEAANLNALGCEGWELAAIHPNHQMVFKRPRAAAAPPVVRRPEQPQELAERGLARSLVGLGPG